MSKDVSSRGDGRDAAASGRPAHVALYRKYRPMRFADVRGQDHIVKVLESSLESGRITHAYLFSGSRGTGKTTFARIFAHELKTSNNDIYEIDAASNRGIDDIRAIRDAVNVSPLESPYKVYIIDEVHMLTKEAFNALLKTLEEPPKHVIFILATTEVDKLPETIISRCQTFSFKKPSRDILRELVSSVAKKEGVTLDTGAADLVALLGDGSFRDTLGTLDKVISSGADTSAKNNKITLADVELITGAPKSTLVNNFLIAITKGDVIAALSAVSEADKASIDMKVFLALILEKARFGLLLKSTKGSPAASGIVADIKERLSGEDFLVLEGLALGNVAGEKNKLNSSTLVELLRAYDETGRAYIPSLPLELAAVKICE